MSILNSYNTLQNQWPFNCKFWAWVIVSALKPEVTGKRLCRKTRLQYTHVPKISQFLNTKPNRLLLDSSSQVTVYFSLCLTSKHYTRINSKIWISKLNKFRDHWITQNNYDYFCVTAWSLLKRIIFVDNPRFQRGWLFGEFASLIPSFLILCYVKG